mmetsp:Transcript_64029/g.198733  ORF Transcript_64029/g.198733 Transcript_64029/m.198733 type:complete len:317 (-) Transcript_64029:840-1790(-)
MPARCDASASANSSTTPRGAPLLEASAAPGAQDDCDGAADLGDLAGSGGADGDMVSAGCGLCVVSDQHSAFHSSTQDMASRVAARPSSTAPARRPAAQPTPAAFRPSPQQPAAARQPEAAATCGGNALRCRRRILIRSTAGKDPALIETPGKAVWISSAKLSGTFGMDLGQTSRIIGRRWRHTGIHLFSISMSHCTCAGTSSVKHSTRFETFSSMMAFRRSFVSSLVLRLVVSKRCMSSCARRLRRWPSRSIRRKFVSMSDMATRSDSCLGMTSMLTASSSLARIRLKLTQLQCSMTWSASKLTQAVLVMLRMAWA